MLAVIVVPGIMGTELFLPRPGDAGAEKVWPPTPWETQFGYDRREKLASPALVLGDLIPNVLCFNFYQPLIDQLVGLGFTLGDASRRLIKFPYDWRRDLFDTAARLADVIEAAWADGATEISLVAHSMGGLVSRLIFEDLQHRNQPWFGAMKQLIAIATPHLGAPLALARVLGRDSALGISGADFAWLASNTDYPSAYQLLPAPGEGACWDQDDPALRSLDIYDPAVAAALGLNPAQLARAQALHAVLGAGNAPPGVRYFYFAGAGHRTATRVNVFRNAGGAINLAKTVVTRTEDSGDGTVPMYSALPQRGQRHIAINEHATAFTGDPFHRAFVRLLGGNAGPALERVPVLALSVEAPLVPADEDIEILLHSADEDTGGFTEVKGQLVIARVAAGEPIIEDGEEFVPLTVEAEIRKIDISYAGPPLDKLRLIVAAVGAPGHYQIRFIGKPQSAGPVMFSACAPLRRLSDEAAAG